MFCQRCKLRTKNNPSGKYISLRKIFQLYSRTIYLLVILAIIVLVYLAMFTSKQIVTKSIEDSNRLICSRISASFEQMISIAQYLAYSDIFQKYLTCDNEYELIERWKQLDNLTQPFIRTNRDLYSIIIYRSSHRVPYFSNYPFSDNAPFYSIASSFESETSSVQGFDVIFSHHSNQPSYAIYSYPIINVNDLDRFGEFLGSVVIVLNPDFLDTVISLSAPKDIISSISITDENGIIIADTYTVKSGTKDNSASLSTIKTNPIEGTNWTVTCYPNNRWIIRQYLSVFLVLALFLFLTVIVLLTYDHSLRQYFSRPVISLCEELRALTLVQNGQLSIYNTEEINEIAENINALLIERNLTSDKMHQLEMANYEAQLSKKVSDLQFLISQINPHFLLNTLSCIGGIASLYQADEIMDIISNLSEMFRYSLYQTDMVTLGDEYNNIQKYFNIIRIRFQDAYSLESSISDELLNYPMPKMILQPLVENSLYHGLEPKNYGHILLSAHIHNNRLYITVSDDGIGMSSEQVISMQEILNNSTKLEYSTLLEKKVGNINVCRRIKLLYGEEYGMQISSVPSTGTAVTVFFPVLYDS